MTYENSDLLHTTYTQHAQSEDGTVKLRGTCVYAVTNTNSDTLYTNSAHGVAGMAPTAAYCMT